MRSVRMLLVAGLALGLAGGALPAAAQTVKEVKGVLEKVDVPGHHVIVRETRGRKYAMPLAVAADAKIVTPAGEGSLDALHVGDEVVVHYGTGAHGEEASKIEVTKAAASK